MRINDYSIINVVESKDFVSHHVNFLNKVKIQDLENIETYEERIMFMKETRFRRLVLSEKTEKNLSNYMVPKNIRFDVLRSLPNRIDSVMINKDYLLRYIKTDNSILGMFDYVIDGNLHNYYFRFDLVDEKLLVTGNDKQSGYNQFKEVFFNKFMVVVTYLELTPVTLEILEGGRSFGIKKEGKIKNDTNKRFILVNTNWNVEKIDLRDIHVRGHWRLQPYGTGRSKYKYIFIKPYEKGLIHRLPQKELV